MLENSHLCFAMMRTYVQDTDQSVSSCDRKCQFVHNREVNVHLKKAVKCQFMHFQGPSACVVELPVCARPKALHMCRALFNVCPH